MAMNPTYLSEEPSRAAVDALQGPVLIEFGAPWCGHCQAAQPLLAEAMASFPTVQHLKIEDGPGRRLGRSFHVKLWPTLIFMQQGVEQARLVRPHGAADLAAALARLVEA